jgi:hypothetical protein
VPAGAAAVVRLVRALAFGHGTSILTVWVVPTGRRGARQYTGVVVDATPRQKERQDPRLRLQCGKRLCYRPAASPRRPRPGGLPAPASFPRGFPPLWKGSVDTHGASLV